MLVLVGSFSLVFLVELITIARESLVSATMLNGRSDVAIVMRRGVRSAVESTMPVGDARRIASMTDQSAGTGVKMLVSAETAIGASAEMVGGRAIQGVQLNGINLDSLTAIRPDIHLVSGRAPSSGLAEAIVSSYLQQMMGKSLLGTYLEIGGFKWHVVGIFDAPVSYSMDVFADNGAVNNFYDHPFFQVMRIKVSGISQITEIEEALRRDPRLSDYKVMPTTEYYAIQASGANNSIRSIGLVIIAITGVVVLLSSLNSTYTAIDTRRRELFVIRAIGFNRFDLAAGTILETWILTMIGAAAAIFFVAVFLDNKVLHLRWLLSGPSVFRFQLSLQSVMLAIRLSSAVGILGGWLPVRAFNMLPLNQYDNKNL